ncbi:MAG: hypothetical protein EZS28_029034 [Streblomastix strix]|uniref:Uncharacterized protein n=1 Tax=Streblomastix strix TaxID=222440 RepID=A0A5J4UY65_9EUKA|nr:MAG: hypothetical protein EZS28_029034 [Streblomastix strix]
MSAELRIDSRRLLFAMLVTSNLWLLEQMRLTEPIARLQSRNKRTLQQTDYREEIIGNEGDSDQIGQLFDSIQSQKTEGSTTTSIWSQESIQNNSTFGSKGIDCTCSGNDQLHSRFSEQVGQLGGLQYEPIIGANPISLVEPRANSGFIRKPIRCDSTQLCINRPEGLECTMDRSIQPYMGE